jgi:hypothetical protein
MRCSGLRNTNVTADRRPGCFPKIGLSSLAELAPFLLYYYGGLQIREVAALLRRREGSIKADLFAARARLRAALAADGR